VGLATFQRKSIINSLVRRWNKREQTQAFALPETGCISIYVRPTKRSDSKRIGTSDGKGGFDIIRQKGSHITLHNLETDKTTLVAMHPDELPCWLFKKIIKDTGLT